MVRIILILMVLMLGSCATVRYDSFSAENWEVIVRNSNTLEASFSKFSGNSYQEVKVDRTKEIQLNLDSKLNSGSLEISLVDAKQTVVWTSKEQRKNQHISTTVPVDKDKNYKVLIKGKNAAGYFKITWE